MSTISVLLVSARRLLWCKGSKIWDWVVCSLRDEMSLKSTGKGGGVCSQTLWCSEDSYKTPPPPLFLVWTCSAWRLGEGGFFCNNTVALWRQSQKTLLFFGQDLFCLKMGGGGGSKGSFVTKVWCSEDSYKTTPCFWSGPVLPEERGKSFVTTLRHSEASKNRSPFFCRTLWWHWNFCMHECTILIYIVIFKLTIKFSLK